MNDSVTRFVVGETRMSNQVRTVLCKNGGCRLERIPPVCAESGRGILAEIGMLDNRRERNQERRVGRAFPRERIDAKRITFNKLSVTTAIVCVVRAARACRSHALAAA